MQQLFIKGYSHNYDWLCHLATFSYHNNYLIKGAGPSDNPIIVVRITKSPCGPPLPSSLESDLHMSNFDLISITYIVDSYI